jgi:hypothetical protein
MVKLLVAGDVQDYDTLLAKISSVHTSKAGPFDVCFVSRLSAAAWRAIAAAPAAPIPIFALADALEAPLAAAYAEGKPGAAAANVVFLGPGAGVTDIGGLRVAFASGVEGDGGKLAVSLAVETAGGSYVDVFLTSRWPAEVVGGEGAAGLSQAVSRAAASGVAGIARLAALACPRYHFAGGGDVFLQRTPYVNPSGVCTRFIGLASAPLPGEGEAGAGGDGKGERKWMHALNLPPAAGTAPAILREAPAGGSTPNPYAAAGKRAAAARGGEEGPAGKRARVEVPDGGEGGAGAGAGRNFVPAGLLADRVAQLHAEAERAAGRGTGPEGAGAGAMFWGTRGGTRPPPRDGRGGGRGGGAPGPSGPPPECWFCLASPHVEKHLVVSVGNEAYLALPKGGLHPLHHLLIVPIAHHASLASSPAPLQEEVARFLTGIEAWFASLGLRMLTFERVLHRDRMAGGAPPLPTHTHVQVIGLPVDKAPLAAPSFKSEGAFRLPAITFEELPPGTQLMEAVAPPPGGPGGHDTCEYLFVEAPGVEAAPAEAPAGVGEGGAPAAAPPLPPRVRLLHRVPQGARHPVQFGRETLCRLLGAPEKIQWKACVSGTEAETAACAEVRASIAPFDFTLSL